MRVYRRTNVARICTFCDKTPVVGHKVSHSNIKTKIRHFPNLHRMRALIDGVSKRVYVCTRCLRSGFLTKPLVRNYTAPETAASHS